MRWFRYVALILLDAIFLCACKNSGNVDSDTEEITLFPEKIATDYSLGITSVVYANDSCLIIRPYKSDFLLGKYLLSGDSAFCVAKIGSKGVGPGEIPTLTSLITDRENDKLMIYDSNSGIAIEYDSLLESAPRSIDAFHEISSSFITNGAYLSTDTILACRVGYADTYEHNNWFVRVNLRTNESIPVKGFSPDDSYRGPHIVKQFLYNGGTRIARQPGTSKFVYGCSTGRYAEIFEVIGDTVVNRKVLLDQYPVYEADSDGLNPTGTPDEEYNGVDVATTSQFIYILVSPHTHGFFKKRIRGLIKDSEIAPAHDSAFSDLVIIFNWDGKAIARLKLDDPVIDIAVTSDNSFIYGISEDSNHSEVLLRYSLPPLCSE